MFTILLHNTIIPKYYCDDFYNNYSNNYLIIFEYLMNLVIGITLTYSEIAIYILMLLMIHMKNTKYNSRSHRYDGTIFIELCGSFADLLFALLPYYFIIPFIQMFCW